MSVDVHSVERSQIIIAGGDVTMVEKQRLTVADIPQVELDVVSRAWVDTGHSGGTVMTASDAVSLLTSDGPALAVISGAVGYGKRTAGIRALWQVSRAERDANGERLPLKAISPDWDRQEKPDIGSLPDQPGTAYLLDVGAEINGWEQPAEVAQALVTHGERLRRIGSYLVVIVDEHSWPEGASGTLGRVVVRAKSRPAPHRVAQKHLEFLYGKPERVRWLNTTLKPDGTGMVGQAAHLLSESSAPAAAARLASDLAQAEDSTEGLNTALSAFQQWRTEVNSVFKETGAADRALLVATLFLSGSEAIAIQDASRRLLGKEPQNDVEAILTGPDLSARLRAVGAEVTGRHATFDHKPGYAQAVLNHLWQQRPDIHRHLLKWLDTITAPGEVGASRLAVISDLLVELAITENDVRIIDQIHTWIGNGNTTAQHEELIAGVFTRAALADALGAKVRTRLLDWAQSDQEPVAKVVALVCQGEFATHYPRQTLVRLRHILDRPEPDTAVRAAETAVRAMAVQPGQLPRVWETVIKWATQHGHLAGHRAFLSLLDPQDDAYVLQVLMEAANRTPEVRAAILRGWHAALADIRVANQCRDLMVAWAHVRAEGLVPRDLVTDVLRQVITEHLYTSPVAALVFGEPGVQYDEPVIALRKDLHLPILTETPPIGSETAEP
ncbi:hypothetical protein [Streptomyces sp. NPDC004658]|uniref:hypothetical protein n=1 Tax=Streptomyces sp. NPDC004658 TaxID=3154672 RepID=UPI0033BEC93B